MKPSTPTQVVDFSQEWLSAKCFWAGKQVYTNQNDSVRWFIPEVGDRQMLIEWNAHPPAAVLLALPFGLFDYPTAMLWWNIAMIPLLLGSILLIARQPGFQWSAWSVLPVIVLTMFCWPLRSQFELGQLNVVLVFLVVASWAYERKGYSAVAGAILVLATAIKFVPGLLFVYFLYNRKWKAICWGMGAFVLVNTVAMRLFGYSAFETYFWTILPGVSQFINGWWNDSVRGFAARTFEPMPDNLSTRANYPLIASDVLSSLTGYALQLIIIALCWLLLRKSAKEASPDRAFAGLCVAMVLLSPVAWPHYRVLLLFPLIWVWSQSKRLFDKIIYGVVVFGVWIPKGFPLILTLGLKGTAAFTSQVIGDFTLPPLAPIHHLIGFSMGTYCLLGLFGLALWLPRAKGAQYHRKDSEVDHSRRSDESP